MNRHFKLVLSKLIVLSLMIFLLFISSVNGHAADRDFYQIRIYRLDSKAQELRVDRYLKEAFIPALHRAGIEKIGVFKPIESDTVSGNIIIVWIPFKSLEQFEGLPENLRNDAEYLTAGKDYIDAAYNNPPYFRIESILLKAFSEMPHFEVPQFSTLPRERIYELRSYQSATEKLYHLKVEMFNEGGEVDLFKRLGFNPMFFAEVISGSTMPNLMYMTTFSDMASHDEHWDTFINHPDWKTMSGLAKYKNTVSRAEVYLLHPTDYSDM